MFNLENFVRWHVRASDVIRLFVSIEKANRSAVIDLSFFSPIHDEPFTITLLDISFDMGILSVT